jgi:hypothetical protein
LDLGVADTFVSIVARGRSDAWRGDVADPKSPSAWPDQWFGQVEEKPGRRRAP